MIQSNGGVDLVGHLPKDSRDQETEMGVARLDAEAVALATAQDD
jgi:hypothetical protein